MVIYICQFNLTLGNATAEDCANLTVSLSLITQKSYSQNIYNDGGFSSVGVIKNIDKLNS